MRPREITEDPRRPQMINIKQWTLGLAIQRLALWLETPQVEPRKATGDKSQASHTGLVNPATCTQFCEHRGTHGDAGSPGQATENYG